MDRRRYSKLSIMRRFKVVAIKKIKDVLRFELKSLPQIKNKFNQLRYINMFVTYSNSVTRVKILVSIVSFTRGWNMNSFSKSPE